MLTQQDLEGREHLQCETHDYHWGWGPVIDKILNATLLWRDHFAIAISINNENTNKKLMSCRTNEYGANVTWEKILFR